MARRFQEPEKPQVTGFPDTDHSTPPKPDDLPEHSVESDSSPLNRVDRALHRIRSTPAGRLGLKITVTVLGAVIIAIGIVLLPLPGPGWLIIFAGLAVWSIEFHWARRLNRFVRRQVFRWTTWYAEQGWPMRIVVGIATLLFVVAVVGISLRLSFGPGIFNRILFVF